MGIKSRIAPVWESGAATLGGHMPPDIVFSDLRMPGIRALPSIASCSSKGLTWRGVSCWSPAI